MTASNAPLLAIDLATTGSSKHPGTQATCTGGVLCQPLPSLSRLLSSLGRPLPSLGRLLPTAPSAALLLKTNKNPLLKILLGPSCSAQAPS